MTRRVVRHQAKWMPVRRQDGAQSQDAARLRRAGALTGALILAAGLAGCGKVGQLERPGPLFGAERNTTKDADDAQRERDPSRPVDTVDPRDRSTDPAPPRTLPIPGTNRGPGALAPPSALPDPYANPR